VRHQIDLSLAAVAGAWLGSGDRSLAWWRLAKLGPSVAVGRACHDSGRMRLPTDLAVDQRTSRHDEKNREAEHNFLPLGLGYLLPLDPNKRHPVHYGREVVIPVTAEDMNPKTIYDPKLLVQDAYIRASPIAFLKLF
jgi:hypothetical protein